MLHVLDGDATRPAFEAAALDGRAVVWREALLEGPWPRALRGVDDALAAVEEAARSSEEVVLWFDDDLFCRLHAAYFAHRFPHARLSNARGSHAARAPADMRAHLARRAPLDVALAEAWRAYAASDPRGLVPLAARFPWLRLHLGRFPSARDGLNDAERRMLEALREGPLGFRALHRRVAQGDLAPTSYGLGDAETARLLAELARGERPLVRLDARPEDAAATLTADGEAVLEGRADRVALCGLDRWLGGAHLRGTRDVWRYDGARLLRA